jgi:hypothetical protein
MMAIEIGGPWSLANQSSTFARLSAARDGAIARLASLALDRCPASPGDCAEATPKVAQVGRARIQNRTNGCPKTHLSSKVHPTFD